MINREQLNKFKTEIEKFIIDGEHSFLFLQGDSGSGKTTAIKELIKEVRQRESRNFITYLHAPLPATERNIYQALLLSLQLNFTVKRTQFEMFKIVENVISVTFGETGVPTVFVIDDAENLKFGNWSQSIESFKQLAEIAGAKFIFCSAKDLVPSTPISILRKSCTHRLETA
ncbi:ATP-binding protein [Paenibacillus sp. GP183]|jgi:Cdc6-like AAA superfamily ATPase|uniref:ATP-binding protein n=1 Tax=Paenibacillus sp. GP183 TaxID=1882751 RepID=UPI000897BC0B|nr:ATP-binding protein [Paenibacillus sp. GP183]SEC78329.1 AAA domain-containing protein [Paenibacillus sp. GP183]